MWKEAILESRISGILVKINYRFRIFGFFVVLDGNKRRVINRILPKVN